MDSRRLTYSTLWETGIDGKTANSGKCHVTVVTTECKCTWFFNGKPETYILEDSYYSIDVSLILT